jgi:hypothetical protein
VAFWLNEYSANPDSEITAAVRPGLATTGGALLMISSPYARRGELWRTYSRHYGPNGDPLVLVAQGSSRNFNPTLPRGGRDLTQSGHMGARPHAASEEPPGVRNPVDSGRPREPHPQDRPTASSTEQAANPGGQRMCPHRGVATL